jgi:hypothetical protein
MLAKLAFQYKRGWIEGEAKGAVAPWPPRNRNKINTFYKESYFSKITKN